MPDGHHPADVRLTRLFRDGPHQAVRIPEGMELEGVEVEVRKVGDQLVIAPVKEKKSLSSLRAYFASLAHEPDLTDDEAFPEIDDPHPEPVDL